MKPKRVALYGRVSTLDQHPESQLNDLRQMAQQRGWNIVGEYVDHGVSGTRARRPQLDRLLADAHRKRFDIVAVWAFDRMARSVTHLLQVFEEFKDLNIEFVSRRENIDTSGPLGRALTVIISAIAELERSLIVERVRSGMRRAQMEGRRIGRTPVEVDRAAVIKDRQRGLSLNELARAYGVSRSTIARLVRDENKGVSKGGAQAPPQTTDSTEPKYLN